MPQILIKNKAIEDTLHEIVKAFYDLYPDVAAAFETIVREESAALVKPSGLSQDGALLNWCKIPAKLYAFIKYEMAKLHGIDDFFRDYDHYKLLMKVWQTAAVRRKRTKVHAKS